MPANVQEWLSGCEGTPYMVGPVPAHASTALTYRDWLLQHSNRVMAGDPRPVRVQVLRRGVKSCAVVNYADPGESYDWFNLSSEDSRRPFWMPGTKVRLCSGDHLCTCERAAAEAAGGAPACGVQPAAQAVPLGNTGTTVGAGA